MRNKCAKKEDGGNINIQCGPWLVHREISEQMLPITALFRIDR